MKKLVIILTLLALIFIVGFYFAIFQRGGVSSRDTTAVWDVTTNFFQACSAGDWPKARSYCHYVDDINKTMPLDGLQIINIGKPFKRFWYPGIFVPFKIVLKNGETRKFNLAIRNDNPKKEWLVDGGL